MKAIRNFCMGKQKQLSRERFYLLSDEEKQQVIKESSMFNDDLEKLENDKIELNESDYREFIEYMLGDEFINEVKKQLNENEYSKALNESFEDNFKNLNALNEGSDQYPGIGAWQISGLNKGALGWLGGMAFAGLSALMVFIAKLGSHIKQQILIAALRRYMKKLVELTDNGAYKRKGIFALFHRVRLDDDNKTCLKTLQKMNERRFCMYTSMAAKNDGFSFQGNPYGGLQSFNNNVVKKIVK